ncbi:MAG: hypothetical protein P1P90_01860 [Patescibacteria group bacterium]|nr:hypothetical protein [Patescibacteria group bacterium]
MDATEIICISTILICTPLSYFLLRFAFKKNTLKNQVTPIVTNKPPESIERTLRMNSSHNIDIFEETGTILAIPNPIKRKKPISDWD